MKSSKCPQPKFPKPKRPRGRPMTRVIEPIDAPHDEMVKAVFRVADQERDQQLKETRQPISCLGMYIIPRSFRFRNVLC